jgi:thymidylate synthase ThyX
MSIAARVLADSTEQYGHRLTTLEVVMPRIVLAEFNTHRVFSRNSASSRAIPVKKQIQRVMEDPFVPEQFPINQPGMSAEEYIGPEDEKYVECRHAWLDARMFAVKQVEILLAKNIHKQIASRLLEPFMWHTVIVSATEWQNFFELRCHPAAQPEMRKVAEAIRDAMQLSKPAKLFPGEWHLPMAHLNDFELTPLDKISACVGRCARVSYLTHDGRRDSYEDVVLAQRLQQSGHWSPWEHVATPSSSSFRSANFKGWTQARWYVENNVPMLTKEDLR